MVAITATNSATPSLRASLGRARLDQARREADMAEANARDLRARADAAEQQAAKSEINVQRISASLVREGAATYARPRTKTTSEVPLKVQNLIEQMYNATSSARAQAGNPLKTQADGS